MTRELRSARSTSTASIAVMIARIGPYHAARLAAARRAMPSARCVALEVAGDTGEYAWDRVEEQRFERHTLFPGEAYEAVPFRRRAAATVQWLEQETPDAVAIAGWAPSESRAALGWCIRRNRVAVLMSDSQETDAVRSAWKERIKAGLVQLYDSALVAGPTHREYLVRLGMPEGSISFGYDVVDNSHFAEGAAAARREASAVRRRLGLPDRYFLVVARFIPQKNLDRLLRAYAEYRRAVGAKAWSLVMLGDGPLRTDLLALSNRLSLGAELQVRGFVQYPELPPYYGLAGACILPSVSETWGLVTNEAMAAGLPVLVSSKCGSAALVEDGVNGYRFAPEDEQELAKLMKRLSGDEAALVAMGNSAARTIAEFDVGRFGQGLVEAWQNGDSVRRRRTRSRMAGWALRW